MPPTCQRGQPRTGLSPNRWGVRYYDADRTEAPRKSPFPSKSAALRWYRDVIEPQLRGETGADARADARRVRPAVPGAPRRQRPAADDRDAARAAQRTLSGRSATFRSANWSG